MSGPGGSSGRGGGSGQDGGRTGPMGVPQAGDADMARTWWGKAWVRTVEESTRDAARLARGRMYAHGGGVDAVRARAGRVTGYVHGSRPRPYRAELRLPLLSDDEWDAFLDAVAAQPAHVAAMLDREVPRAAVAEAETAGVRLLPDRGDLVPGCSCPDSARACKHAAALGYAAGRLLDDDPFVLLRVRGRDENEVREELVRRSASHEADVASHEADASPAARPTPPPARGRRTDRTGENRTGEKTTADAPPQAAGVPTVAAREYLTTAVRPPLPGPLPPPEVPGEPGPYPDIPGGPSPDGLAFLAMDAAHRAYEALAAGEDPLPDLFVWHDTIRLAATHPHLTGRRALSPLFAGLARTAGHTAPELTRAAAAWRQGGPDGLAVLDEPWDPPAGDFDRARSVLAGAGVFLNIRRNHLTHPTRHLQLRYGRDGRWYPYRSDGDGADWWPEGPAADDPLTALSGVPDA